MKRREDIKSQLEALNVKESWLAEQLDIKRSVLHLLLNDSGDIDRELYESIKEILDSYQFDLGLLEEDESENYNLFDDEKLSVGIGNRIRIFAKRKYGTLKSLAVAMNVSPQQLQQYVSGKREPGSKILAKLLRLGCDINWLLGGSESMESYKIYRLEKTIRDFHAGYSEISDIVNKQLHKHKV